MFILSSQKVENRLHPLSPNEGVPAVDSVGRMFNSIQGLQQRLNDFSLDEVAKASDTCKTLILSLAELQRRVARIAKIGKFVTAARGAIEGSTAGISDLCELIHLDTNPDAQETAHAGKIIQFPRSPRVSWNNMQAVTRSASELPVPEDSSRTQIINTHFSFAQPTAAEATDPKFSAPQDSSAVKPLGESQQPSKSPNLVHEIPGCSNQSAEIPPAPQPETPQSNGTSTITVATGTLASSEPHSTGFDEPSVTDFQLSLASDDDEKQADEPRASEATEANSLVPVGATFDQRLLQDLIKDYGEFASSPNVPIPIERKNDPDLSTKSNEQNNSATSSVDPQPAIRNLPRIRNEGDIDRKLKKLIKDYGEIDLYSRQSPVNLKTAVVGAFLLLIAIFSGFYLFSAPKDAVSSRPVSGAENKMDSSQVDADVRNHRTRAGVKPTKSAGDGAVEIPRSAEANELDPIPNQDMLKKITKERRLGD